MSNPDTASGSSEVPLREPLTIHSATADDIPSIVEIESESFPSRWKVETYQGELKNPIALFLVAKCGKQVVGFSLSWLVTDELHIMKIASTPEFRRKGVATELMRRSIKVAKQQQSKIAHLEVRESNLAAQNFYKKLAFQTLGVRKKYYTDTNEDGLILAAKLDDVRFEDRTE